MTTKKFNDLRNRFVIRLPRVSYLEYLKWDFGLNKKKNIESSEKYYKNKFKEFKEFEEKTEGSTFITVTIPYRVRHNIEKPTVAAFRKAQVRFYTTLVLLTCKILQVNGMKHLICKTLQDNGVKNPMIYNHYGPCGSWQQDNGMKHPMTYMLDMNTESDFDIREIYSQTSDSDVSHEKITIK
tara:strand:+ start:966 stop:1511 length:546 start_codon:yes stop_codon:yes gene_type:complete